MHFNELIQNWFIAMQAKWLLVVPPFFCHSLSRAQYALCGCEYDGVLLSLNNIFPLGWRCEFIAHYLRIRCSFFVFIRLFLFFSLVFKFVVKQLFFFFRSLSTQHSHIPFGCAESVSKVWSNRFHGINVFRSFLPLLLLQPLGASRNHIHSA